MLTGKQRAYLKGLANQESPIINIGKNSLTPSLIKAIDEALKKRELVKIKILNNNMDDQDELINKILEELDADFVSHLGNNFTIYRESEDKVIDLP